MDCESCERPDSCDCPCGLCIGTRLRVAAPRSWIQTALDSEWESANFAGPGCPFCDALFSCSCWAQRAEMREAEERRRLREERAEIAARIARGECFCDQLNQDPDYPSECEICEREEELRCKECGGLPCKPECCGGCGGCSRCRGDPCKMCGDYDDRCNCYDDRYEDDDYDPSDPYGDGAPEEHPGHPGYDGY